jgi:hypothetical protein
MRIYLYSIKLVYEKIPSYSRILNKGKARNLTFYSKKMFRSSFTSLHKDNTEYISENYKW